MDLLTISLLAIIQGITEFLPISSSGHLALAPKLFGFSDPGLAVDAFLHLGTLFAALIYFRKDIRQMFFSLLPNANKSNMGFRHEAIGIMIATIPVILIGFFFKDFFSDTPLLRDPKFIAFTLAAGALLMLFAEIYSKKFSSNIEIQKASWWSMLFIGSMQCLALFPGMSRSGSTISASLFAGVSKADSSKLAFLVGLPAIAAAGALALKDLFEAGFTNINEQALVLGLGFVLSFISGYFAIDFMIKFLKTQSLIVFVIYRIILAIVLFVI